MQTPFVCGSSTCTRRCPRATFSRTLEARCLIELRACLNSCPTSVESKLCSCTARGTPVLPYIFIPTTIKCPCGSGIIMSIHPLHPCQLPIHSLQSPSKNQLPTNLVLSACPETAPAQPASAPSTP